MDVTCTASMYAFATAYWIWITTKTLHKLKNNFRWFKYNHIYSIVHYKEFLA